MQDAKLTAREERSPMARMSAALACGAGLLSLVVYLRTLAPGLTWLHVGADGGDLAAAVATAGIPHPPGYPTYMLLGRLFALLPFGDVTLRLNLLSAVCAALAVALLYLLTPVLAQPSVTSAFRGRGQGLAAVAALTFAFSPLFWSQAVITEVYALNAALVAALLLVAAARPGQGRLLAFLLGLGLGNHLSLVLLVPTLCLLCWAGIRQMNRGVGLATALCFVAGLGVYTYLPIRAAAGPLINWGDPRTLDRLMWMVTGAPYRGYVFSLPAGELPARLSAWAALLVQQFTWPGLALILLGLWDMAASGERRQAAALALAFALYSAYSLGYATADSYVYMIPAYLVAVPWLARGTLALARAVGSLAPAADHRQRLLTSVATIALCLLLPLWQLRANWHNVDAGADESARAYGQGVVAGLPQRALVITASDEHTFALWYYQVALARTDVAVVDRDLTQFAWYREQIRQRHPDLAAAPDSDTPAEYIAGLAQQAQASRNVFLADDDSTLRQRFLWQKDGALERMVKP